MKKLFLVVAVTLLSSYSKAQMLTNAQSVKVVVPYQTTCSSATIGTSATEMTGNTALLSTTAGISAYKLTNLSTTATVCCSHSSSVSCTAGDNTYGDPVAPSSVQKNWLSWAISVMQGWYCISTAANTSVISCKVR